MTTNYRAIPSIDQLSQRPKVRALEAAFGRTAVIDAIRAEAAAVRDRLAAGLAATDVPALIEQGARDRLEAALRPSLVPVINATGVVIHTNLGRAPLPRAAADRVAALTTGYSNLEYDLSAGRRGHRDVHAERLLCRVTGADAAVIVNNNAAATLLTLAALAAGREVIISRGELVEIGGGFRVPDVLAQSGAVLREVGTTNKTRVADYAAAISDRTALILRVHPSNFSIQGFTERPDLAELAAMAARFDLPVVEDLGSGFLGEPGGVAALGGEPVVSASLAAGVALVLFSADKLLGGPQAGVIAGRAAAVSPVRRHPLMRALRAGKLTYAALEATLEEIAAGRAGVYRAGDADDRAVDRRNRQPRRRARRAPERRRPARGRDRRRVHHRRRQRARDDAADTAGRGRSAGGPARSRLARPRSPGRRQNRGRPRGLRSPHRRARSRRRSRGVDRARRVVVPSLTARGLVRHAS